MARVIDDRVRPGLADGPRNRPIEVGDDPLGGAVEAAEEGLPALDVLAAVGLEQTRHGRPSGRIEGGQDRASLEIADPLDDRAAGRPSRTVRRSWLGDRRTVAA